MTQVAFHFGAPDKLAYVCRLIRKATVSGARLQVIGDVDSIDDLDQMLWAMGATDFVAHCRASSSPSLQRHSTVVLSESDAVLSKDQDSVLVNLKADVPQSGSTFSRVIEVVSVNEDDRQIARQRWKAYASSGFAITRHDIALKG